MLRLIVDLFFILYPAPYQRPILTERGRTADVESSSTSIHSYPAALIVLVSPLLWIFVKTEKGNPDFSSPRRTVFPSGAQGLTHNY
jgi:hypothetical protein